MFRKAFFPALFLCLSSFGQYVQSTFNPDDPKFQVKERRAFLDKCLKAAKKVADSSQDFEAYKVYEVLAAEAIVSVPVMHEGTVKTMIGEKSRSATGNFIAVMVVFKQDLSLSDEFAKQASNGNIAASYDPNSQTMMLKSWMELSDIWLGLLFLHEGRHACEGIFTPYDWRNPDLFCFHERTTHEFENRLIAKIGGPTYAAILDREVKRTQAILDSAKLDWRKAIIDARVIPGLDKLFGKPKSKRESDVRYTHFWVDMYFRFFDKVSSSPAQAAMVKEDFLRSMYVKDGVLKRSF